jgi:hypothetical protein
MPRKEPGLSADEELRLPSRDWLVRLVTPRPQNGNAYNVGVDTAEAELVLARRLGLVHPSLVAQAAA